MSLKHVSSKWNVLALGIIIHLKNEIIFLSRFHHISKDLGISFNDHNSPIKSDHNSPLVFQYIKSQLNEFALVISFSNHNSLIKCDHILQWISLLVKILIFIEFCRSVFEFITDKQFQIVHTESF